MVRSWSSWMRMLGFAGCFAVVSASGADSVANSKPPANPIESAKKDFQTVKSSAADAPPAPAKILSLPAVETESVPVLSPIQQARKNQALMDAKKTNATKNWLIDAVELEKERSRNEKRGGDTMSLPRKDHDEPASRGTGGFDDQGTPTPAIASKKLARSAKPVESANPLETFMASWLSPSDLALLQANPTAAIPAELPVGLAAVSAAPGLKAQSFGESGRRFGASRMDAGTGAKAAASNPYLEPILSPPMRLKNAFGSSAVSPFSAPEPNGTDEKLPAPRVAPQEDKTTEHERNSKAADDAKYFRQLKRF